MARDAVNKANAPAVPQKTRDAAATLPTPVPRVLRSATRKLRQQSGAPRRSALTKKQAVKGSAAEQTVAHNRSHLTNSATQTATPRWGVKQKLQPKPKSKSKSTPNLKPKRRATKAKRQTTTRLERKTRAKPKAKRKAKPKVEPAARGRKAKSKMEPRAKPKPKVKLTGVKPNKRQQPEVGKFQTVLPPTKRKRARASTTS